MQTYLIRCFWAFLCAWLGMFSCLRAQDLSFVKVPLDQEYGIGLIAGITQDKQGFLWIATHSGLYRYDGYQQITYIHNRYDKNSLADNRLECVLADRNGVIWIGVWATGLDRFDPKTGEFTHFRHNPEDPKSLSDDVVTALLEDREGNLWVGTHKGLNLYHPETGTFTHFQHRKDDPSSLSDNRVRAIYQDRQGTIWVGTGSPWESKPTEGGLNRFHPKTGTFTSYKHDPENPNTLFSNWVRAIYEDSKGNFWVGTFGDGLHRMNRRTGSIERLSYDASRPEKLSRPYIDKEKQNDGVNIIHEDHTGAIWIGTYDSGLNRYDPSTGEVKHYHKYASNGAGLDDNNIWAAYSTREGSLWFGTANGNLFRLDPHRHRIPNTYTDAEVYSFYEDPAGFLLLGTSKGLVKKDLKSGKVTRYVNNPLDLSSISSDTVYTIYKDRRGDFWLGNASGDLNKFNAETERFTRYQHDEKDPTSLSGGPIFAMLEDSQDNFWIATGFGLDKMNQRTGTFTHHQSDPDNARSLSHNGLTSVLEGADGVLWIGTRFAGGVNRYNIKSGHAKKYLLGSNISRIYKDSRNVLWVATENAGIYYYKPASDAFIPVKIGYEKEIINVKSIVEDDQHNLWFGTSQGLLKLNKERNSFSLLGESYGIQPGSLTFKAGYKGRDGKLYFGNRTGYYVFDPQQLKPNEHPPLVTFTEMRLFDKPVLPGRKSPLKAPLSETSAITLGPDQNVFSIDFTGIHFTNPEQNKYLFKLENYDHDWRETGAEHTASYYNVPPGSYVFRVRASNSDEVWAEKTMLLRVKPHWWNTWWAYTLYGSTVLALLAVYSRQQRRRLIKIERYRARERELAQAREISKAYKELKRTQARLVQQEKLASLGELTAGIAHEIQNPLNFINNFADVSTELVEEGEQELAAGAVEETRMILDTVKQNLEKIRTHGQRADNIVKNMLQHSRTSTGQKEPTDINALTEEYLQLSYHGLRAKDKAFRVKLQTNYDQSLDKATVVPQEMGRVLLNLFNNAFFAVLQKQKAAGCEYEPKVEVSTRRTDDSIEILVRDNGVGVPEKLKNKIFQPFFTTKPTGQGTGLGLSLCYDIITKGHGGEILVESVEGEFTEFRVLLPVAIPSPAPLIEAV
ncbi:two component regulator with propeller domain [Pontibacter ummariensis]|uniref:histidine kinase n=1 Tax=Pontibacter ummariensis TaxID=1610492 RepID=A0A239D8P2_9BACT|nr:two-component regulator propeller domain-containing protein [Pontibacter ummariensis]PRY14303.1 two component regulator with propeller domain [Pontibacter ummariensis]SNS28667.1 Two component regulator propeller [Pontibacter ummariensis]